MHDGMGFLSFEWEKSGAHWLKVFAVAKSSQSLWGGYQAQKQLNRLIINDKILQTSYPYPLILKPFNHIYLRSTIRSYRKRAREREQEGKLLPCVRAFNHFEREACDTQRWNKK